MRCPTAFDAEAAIQYFFDHPWRFARIVDEIGKRLEENSYELGCQRESVAHLLSMAMAYYEEHRP